MRVTYRVLAYIIAAEVAVQAAFMAYAIAGFGIWIDEGNVFDSAAMDSEEFLFDEAVGFAVHYLNGMYLIPLLALILLVISFFAKIPRGVVFALVLLGWVIVQIFLGLFGHEVAIFGLFHGLVAFAVYGTAFMAGYRAKKPAMDHAAGNAPL